MNLFSLSSNRRVLVIDPGNRSVKALLAWRRDGRVQVTDHRRIDLPDRHRVAPGSIESIETLLKEFAAVPIAISLPQQLSISQETTLL